MLRSQRHRTITALFVTLMPVISGCAGYTAALPPAVNIASSPRSSNDDFSFSRSMSSSSSEEASPRSRSDVTPLKVAISLGELAGLLTSCGLDKDAVRSALASRLVDLDRVARGVSSETLLRAAVEAKVDGQNKYKDGKGLNCKGASEGLQTLRQRIAT